MPVVCIWRLSQNNPEEALLFREILQFIHLSFLFLFFCTLIAFLIFIAELSLVFWQP